MPTPLRSKWLKVVVFIACLSPIALLIVRGVQDDLTANPIEYITRNTGDWTMRFLLLTLAISPLRRLLNQPDLIRYRRMLGLFSFFYGVLHFITWAWLDKFFDAQEMWADVAKRRFITMGMIGFLVMAPLAITSTTGWIRRLGKRWRQLHRLIYVSAVAGVIHYYWLVKSDVRMPLTYAAILAALLLLRLVKTSKPAAALRGR